MCMLSRTLLCPGLAPCRLALKDDAVPRLLCSCTAARFTAAEDCGRTGLRKKDSLSKTAWGRGQTQCYTCNTNDTSHVPRVEELFRPLGQHFALNKLCMCPPAQHPCQGESHHPSPQGWLAALVQLPPRCHCLLALNHPPSPRSLPAGQILLAPPDRWPPALTHQFQGAQCRQYGRQADCWPEHSSAQQAQPAPRLLRTPLHRQ